MIIGDLILMQPVGKNIPVFSSSMSPWAHTNRPSNSKITKTGKACTLHCKEYKDNETTNSSNKNTETPQSPTAASVPNPSTNQGTNFANVIKAKKLTHPCDIRISLRIRSWQNWNRNIWRKIIETNCIIIIMKRRLIWIWINRIELEIKMTMI